MFEILDFPRKGTCNYYFVVADMGDVVDVGPMESAAKALIKDFEAVLSTTEYANLVSLRSGSQYKICSSLPNNATYCKVVLVNTDRMNEDMAESVITPLVVNSMFCKRNLYWQG